MKTLVCIWLVFPFAVFGQCPPAGNGTLKAEVTGNAVILMNDTAQRNCASWYEMQISQATGDTLIWMQNEQGGGAYCLCHFNLSVTLDSLEPGNYFVKTYYTDFPFPYGDTCYIGLISFTISEQNFFTSYIISDDYMSDCFPVGINEQGQLNGQFFTVYPNPANDKLAIESTTLAGNQLLTVINVNGMKLIERQLGDKQTQIDISALPPGVYFVRLQNDKTVEMKKMIKE